jgi:hypothetical protein
MLNHGYTSGYTDVTRNQFDKKKTPKRSTADDDSQTEIIRETIEERSRSGSGESGEN